MTQKHVIIIGGGLTGLSAGCYARASGFRTTIIEHNLSLGGLCTAWQRGPYTIDGCIRWLTGGAFLRYYDELGITKSVELGTLEQFVTYRNVTQNIEVSITRDLAALERTLVRLSPDDTVELRRLFEAVEKFPAVESEQAEEVTGFYEWLATVGNTHEEFSRFLVPHWRYMTETFKGPIVMKCFMSLCPPEAPATFLLFLLAYLGKGCLHFPKGGTASFRDALIDSYHRLGGEERVHATADEILVEGDRVTGVRLANGEIMHADAVISTASAPETVLRLLGGRYSGDETRRRLKEWMLFPPTLIASFGVALSFSDLPPNLAIDGINPFEVGGASNEFVVLKFWKAPDFAPPGHSVVQVFLNGNYDWWATRGTRYNAEKDALAEVVLEQLSPYFPGIREAVKVIDIATPMTFWKQVRSWHGAFRGWMPGHEGRCTVDKTLPGLTGLYMAGQWVDLGGGVPTSIVSGRQAVRMLCNDQSQPFSVPKDL